MKLRVLTTTLALLSAGLAHGVLAAGIADNIAAVGPFIRLVPPGASATAAYLVLKNNGDRDARLVRASTPAARVAELHEHVDEHGVMKMRKVDAIEIKAHGNTVLQPGGLHLMLIDPAPMQEGDKVAITLGFDDGSSKQIDVPVLRPAPASMSMPAGPAAAPMDHPAHQH